MKRNAPYWETPLDLFKLLMTALGVALLIGMLRGCLPGGPEAAVSDIDVPDVEAPIVDMPNLGMEFDAPSFDLSTMSETDLASLTDGGYELSGNAAPGAEIEMFDGARSLGKVLADADGKWLFSLPALAAGAHALRLTGPDGEGGMFDLSLPSFDLSDLEMPDVNLVAPEFNLPDLGASFMAADLPPLSGNAAPGALVAIYDGDTLLGEVTAGDDGSWKFDLGDLLESGEHTLRAVVIGDQDEVSSPTWSFTVLELEDDEASDGAEAAGEDDASDAASGEEEDDGGDSTVPAGLPRTGRAPLLP